MANTMVFQRLAPVDLGDVPVDTVGQAIEKIKRANGGVCPPEEYIEAARPERSPIHATLPWDAEAALRDAQMQKARTILQVVVRVVGPADEQPYHNVSVTSVSRDGEAVRGYADAVIVREREDWRRQAEREMFARIKGHLRNLSWSETAAGLLVQVELAEQAWLAAGKEPIAA
jgi:hypothetical protein